MRAIKLKTRVASDHTLRLQLPEDVQEGPAEVIVLVPEATTRSSQEPKLTKTVGKGLDHFIGTWTAEQEAEVLRAVEVFEHVDESFWR